MPPKGKGKQISPNTSEDKDKDEPIREPANPNPSEEEAFLSARIEYVATLKYADHPTDPPDQAKHLTPHLMNIQLAIQEGLPVPIYPPVMTDLQGINNPTVEEINFTRRTGEANEPTPEVQSEESPGREGKTLLSPPTPFTGERAKAEDFLQDFNICWRLNRQHPALKKPYDRVILALSFMRGNTAIRNWVRHEMAKMD